MSTVSSAVSRGGACRADAHGRAQAPPVVCESCARRAKPCVCVCVCECVVQWNCLLIRFMSPDWFASMEPGAKSLNPFSWTTGAPPCVLCFREAPGGVAGAVAQGDRLQVCGIAHDDG